MFSDCTSFTRRGSTQTNGITFRRWLYQANPKLTSMLVDALGPDILDTMETRLGELETFAEKQAFRKAFADQRLHSKRALAEIIHERLGISVNPAAMFDVQVKRIHEYKRQLLNLLHTVALYQAIRAEPESTVPRVRSSPQAAAVITGQVYHQADHASPGGEQ